MAGHAADPRAHPHGLPACWHEPARQHRRQEPATCTAGRCSVPLVVRCDDRQELGPGRAALAGAALLFMHVPGLKVVAPTNAYDAKGCLIAAIRDDNPVIFVEHRLLHSQKGPCRRSPTRSSPARPASCADGRGHHPRRHLLHAGRVPAGAASCWPTSAIRAEVIDPIWLMPLDIDTIVRVGRADGPAAGGRQRLDELRGERRDRGARGRAGRCTTAPVRCERMGFAPTTCPTTPALEQRILSQPGQDRGRPPTSSCGPARRPGQPDPRARQA